MLLCHCLAGGLPRAVLRFAWDVVTYTQMTGTVHVDKVAAALVSDHVTKKIDATLVSTHRLEPSPPVHELQAWLIGVRSQGKDPETLIPLCHDATQHLGSVLSSGIAAEEALELLAYFLFAATVQQFFRVPIGELEQARWHDFVADADRLGTGQQAFSVHQEAAWIATNQVRAGLRLEGVPYPADATALRP
jgi:hypothetical protein